MSTYIEEDADDGYDRVRQEQLEAEIDRGERCPTCIQKVPVSRTKSLGIDLFRCAKCRALWFDIQEERHAA